MSHAEHTQLMHAVLDGVATPGEARELELLLIANPAASAEFDELRHVFVTLQGMPKAVPPEGLVSAVMANIPHRPTHFAGLRQLFTKSRVISTSTIEAPGDNPGTSATVHPIMQRGPHHKGENNMSEQTNSSLGNRKIWIGAGIAAAAVIVAVSTGILPPSGKDTAGTIVPAQRYRADQPTAADVNVGGQAGVQSGQNNQGQAGPGQAGPGQAGPGQAGPGQAGPGQAGPGQAGPSQAGPSQGTARF